MRLYLLQYALGDTGTPVPGYLIRTEQGINILVDTGFPANTEGVAPDNYVLNRLASVGLTPAAVHYLVCSHFDPDHCGGNDLFTDSELIVQRAHYEVARTGDHRRFEINHAHWDHPALRYRLVEGDVELVPGVELIETGGHVPGHQSVLVRLPETGPVLLTIDAIMRHQLLDPDQWEESQLHMDGPATRATIRKLADLIEREGVTLTIFGHDAAKWPTLKKAPEYYQ